MDKEASAIYRREARLERQKSESLFLSLTLLI